MKNEYEKNVEIEATNVDRNLKLSVVQSVELVQNIMTQFFETIESDNIVIKNENNAAWVVSKLKIHFEKYPIWKDKVKLITFITSKSKIKLEVETQLKDNKLLFIAKQELCLIDLDTRKIRKIETVKFPKDIELKESILQESYNRLNYEFKESDKYNEREVYAIDTDYTHHTNNVKYIEFIFHTLNSNFLDNNEITDLEIHYINETVEGEVLKIYKHEEKNKIDFLIKCNEKEIVRANVKYLNYG